MKYLNFNPLILCYIPFLFITSISAQNAKNLVTEVKIYNNDSIFRLKYYYENDKKVLETKSYFENEIWVNLTQTEWYYNNDVCEKQIERGFDTNGWTDKYSIEYQTLDNKTIETHKKLTNSLLIEIKKIETEKENGLIVLQKEINRQFDTWVESIRTENIYLNNILTSSIISYYPTLSTFKQYKSTYEYYADGKLKSQTLQEKSDTENWQNIQLSIWYYFPENHNISTLRNKTWDKNNQKWENKELLSYKYSADNKILEENSYYWKSMFWANNFKYEYKYNEAGLISSKSLLLPIYNKWRNTYTINYSNILNSKNQEIESVYGFWGGKVGDFISTYTPFMFNNNMVIQKAEKISIVYSTNNQTTKIKTDLNTSKILQIFPNPSDGIFYFDTQKHQIKYWRLFNSQGSMVKEINNLSDTGVIDITELPVGIYILKAKTQNRILSQKLYKN